MEDKYQKQIESILTKLGPVDLSSRENLLKVLEEKSDLELSIARDCFSLNPEEVQKYNFLLKTISWLYFDRNEQLRVLEYEELKKNARENG